MKILCLHGKGTSGAIFKSQTSSFRAQLSRKDIEFDFIDGPFKSNAAAGVDLFYPPPYFGFLEESTYDDMLAACDWLRVYISKNGPYDAVMGFSQGTIMASTYLLLHQEETPHLPPPFKAAIFSCGAVSLGVLEELGFNITSSMHHRDMASRRSLGNMASSNAILQSGGSRWQGDTTSQGLSEDQVRDEIKGPLQIPIPTVHIYGTKDPRYSAGVQLSGVCNPENRRTFNHGGGHEIPRTSAVSNTIAELIEWALDEAGV
ncbi:hypothetical protein N7478_005924 [Penicillium angulare]|uniref:uncharacterized protein n=1 Tax=Penicillium angulare TaxID=116970 RepID=UPI002540303E|nr:uncharacterized protein N7478_005924 [Penicillium angulare]KAJ5280552.1 hypothetical protein N7478_005924 [Penicillium angulare]